MRDLSILYPHDTYRLIGIKSVKFPPLVLRRHFKCSEAIGVFLSKLQSVESGNKLYSLISLTGIVTNLVSDIIDITYDEDTIKDKITVSQSVRVLIDIWIDIYAGIIYAQEQSGASSSKPKKVNEEDNIIKALDLLFHEYGWTKEYVWDNITMLQLLVLMNTISTRKQDEFKLLAAVHGIKVDGQPNKEDIKNLQQSVGKQSTATSDDLYGVKEGDIIGLKKLALWIGVNIPDNINPERNESNLRVLVKTRINKLKENNKLPNIDMNIDPIEHYYGIGEGNIIGLMEKLESIGVKVPNVDAIKANPIAFKCVLMAKHISDQNG